MSIFKTFLRSKENILSGVIPFLENTMLYVYGEKKIKNTASRPLLLFGITDSNLLISCEYLVGYGEMKFQKFH